MKIYDRVKYHLRLVSSGRFCDKKENAIQIIKQIKKAASNLKSKKEIGTYIRHQQIDWLQSKKEGNHKNADEVLFFLENYYSCYLDCSLPISDLGKQKLLQTLRSFQEVREKLRSLNTYLEKVLRPILYPEKQKDFTIEQANYLYYLHSKWINEFLPSHPSYQEAELLRFLISNNYNTDPFINYISQQMELVIEAEPNPEIKLAGLNEYLIKINRIPVSINFGFYDDLPSVKTMLKDWLESKIKNCTRELKKSKISGTLTFASNQKLELDLSVDQIAYLTKLFYTSKILTNKSQSEILLIVKRIVRSKGSDDVSLHSLNKKYYNVEDKTKEAVKSLLESLILQID
ncbi:MAG TPA: hypothetical protein VK750_01970 [Cytophagaceae bacterium]|nr:hypothetical protein [Cytophagaceae bacterium]